MSWLLVSLVAVPLAGAAILFAPAMARRGPLRVYGLAVSGLTLALSLLLVATFDYSRSAQPQFEVDREWIPGLGLRFHLGVDGISLPLVVLTALLTFLCFVYLCWGTGREPGQLLAPDSGRPRALVFTLLVLEVGMIGTFVALDLLLFFVFFEVVLIPMYFVIAIWGGAGRRTAAIKFILYTLLGSVVLLLGLLLIWAQTGTLDMVELARAHGAGMARGVQVLAFVAVGIGLAVKTPMWPLHTWLPDAHTEAPTVGSVLLAGVLLKMGTYGFARIAIPILPEGAAAVAPWLGAFAVVGIVYGALACLAQRDLKRMIAYSSIGHMGFVLLGLATLTPTGMNAALFANIAHGLITGLLFFLAGAIKTRYGTAEMPKLGGGMLATLPRLGSVLSYTSYASLGLPGLAGFWGEMLALYSAFQPAPGLPRGLFLAFMAIGGVGALLTAAYFLVMLSRVTHGVPRRRAGASQGAAAAGHPVGVGAHGDQAAEWGDWPWNEARRPVPAGPGSGVSVAEGLGEAKEQREVGGRGEAPVEGRPAAEWPDEEPIDFLAEAGSGDSGTRPEPPRPGPGDLPDIRRYELVAWTPLIVLVLVVGVWPKLLLAVTTPAVQALLGATP
ncbi:complex I subunit 4 family protein [Thermoactinospora rubra]|uniref:complex I subunit 4 family protein n=1 Tax=Thermoactinospora rubra TaxID=1088767 RepID=UPI000A10DA6F|nr:NADH-quinone oxidoreductase subunit M [Thermoactinospora rubra]